MEIAKIAVNGAMACVKLRNLIPAGLVGGYITVEFSDPRWEGLTKTVVFQGVETKDVVTNDQTIKIPPETVSIPGKRLQVGFYGTDSTETLVIPTLWADLGRIMSATDPSGDQSTVPTLPVWAQLAQRIEDLEDQGEPGAGITAEAAQLLITILQAALYGTDQSGNIQKLVQLLNAGYEDFDQSNEVVYTAT